MAAGQGGGGEECVNLRKIDVRLSRKRDIKQDATLGVARPTQSFLCYALCAR